MSTSIKTDFGKPQASLHNRKPLLSTAFAIPTLTWVLFAVACALMSSDQQGAGVAIGMAMMASGFLGGLLSIVLSLVTIAICLFHVRQTTLKDNMQYLGLSILAIAFSIGTFVGVTNLVFADWAIG